MSNGPFPSSAPTDGETVDVFVSYAHADDEVPIGAEQGWVTTLVGELQKVWRRKLGGSGAKVWMDHQLAANQGVTEELLDKIGRSRSLLLVMSPGYQQSNWCQRELANYVAIAAARGKTQSVFPIEIEPVYREGWQPALKSLSPIKFYYYPKDYPKENAGPTLAGIPRPKPDEDSLYWRNVNELAHLIAQRLQAELAAEDVSRKTAVVVAETTDDLDSARQSVASALTQRGDVVILPAVDYPRGTENDYLASVRSDLRNAALFLQLLGPHIGKKAQGSERSFVAIQAEKALRHSASVRVMQWRPRELDPENIADPQYRKLLTGEHVSCLGFEEFRRAVLQALEPLAAVRQETTPALIKQVAPLAQSTYLIDGMAKASAGGRAATANGRISAEGLSLYLQATPEDRDTADEIADDLAGVGASVQLSPEPEPDQTFLQSLMAQEEALRLCDGVLLVYGKSPVTAISAAFQYALRVFGVKRPGVWSAVLDLPPVEKQRVPIRSPNLMTIECRQGFDLAKLGDFFERLRGNGAIAGGVAKHA